MISGVIIGLIMSLGVIALSVGFRLLKFPDLTIEGSIPLGAAVYATTIVSNGSPVLAVLFALLASGLAGFATGISHYKLGVNKFLCGIIVTSICYSLALRVMSASNIGLIGRKTLFEFSNTIVSVGILIAFVSIVAISLVLFFKSTFGVKIRACATSPDFSESIGLRVALFASLGLMITNAFAGLCGAMLAMNFAYADIGMGQGILVVALASMVIGEGVIPNKIGNVVLYTLVAAIVGSLIYQLIFVLALSLGIPATDIKLATGLLVLSLLALKMVKRDDAFFEEIS